MYSSNGGIVWSTQKYTSQCDASRPCQLIGVSAASDQVAWAVGAQGTVLKTIGEPWGSGGVPLTLAALVDYCLPALLCTTPATTTPPSRLLHAHGHACPL